MTYKKNKNISTRIVAKFLEFRKGLSDSDKKMQAGFLVKEIESVDVDNAFNKVSKRIIGRHKINRTITWITRVAAVLTLPLLAFTIWNLTVKNNPDRLAENSLSWQEIQSPAGIRSHIVLPDGSDLWLNAESKIRYSIPFIRKNRQIELSGEAFLHVVKNEKAPFVVNACNTKVKVLGTEFNVKAYPEDKQIAVALKEGSVEFHFVKSDCDEVFTELIPNDYLIFYKEDCKVTIENKQIDKYISWHQNILIFENTPLRELATMIERWYGVEIMILDKEIEHYHFNGTIENETIQDVMQILKMTLSISYTVDHKTITITKLKHE